MQNQLTEFANAVNGAACKIFTDYGAGVEALKTVALIAPPAKPVAIALSLAQLAAKQNCDWDTGQEGPGDETKGGCWKLKDGGGVIAGKNVNGDYAGLVDGNCARPDQQYTEILSTDPTGGRLTVRAKTLLGDVVNTYADSEMVSVFLDPCAGASCDEEGDSTPPPPQPPPYVHTTEEGCQLIVNFQGWGQLSDGSASGIFLIEPAPETRAGGGRIGGCNFEPTIVYNPGGGGGGGGPYTVPYPPDPPGPDGKPLWQKLLEAALAGAVSGLVQNLFDETDKKLDELIEGRTYPGSQYTLTGVCEEGETQPEWFANNPEANELYSVIYRLDSLAAMMQVHLGLKTPVCLPEPETPVIEGQFRTISFRSDETSPFGKSRLRKRLRYRGSEGVELSALVDHWRDFSWQSGPVRVDHVGASWGSPQVWAATADEGKRVIRHAGREAGIDPDQVGRWSARSSNSPRCGVSDTMRVDTTGGYYWITARDGSDQRPIVAK